MLAYVFVSFGTGLLCLGALAVLARREAVARTFLLFYLPLTALVMVGLLLSLSYAFPERTGSWTAALEYVEALPATYLTLLALPLAAQRILRHGTPPGGWIVTLVVTAFVAQHITESAGPPHLDAIGDSAENLLFAGLVAYSVGLAVRPASA